MKIYFLLSVFCFTAFSAISQIGTIQIIDDSESSMGIRHLAAADLNFNGHLDLIAARGSSTDHIAVYWNDGNANFNRQIIDNDINDPVYINYADFNNNGQLDIITVTESDGEIFWYENQNGNFGSPIFLGNVQSFGKAIKVNDFNLDGNQDFVVIGQHSIDLYLNLNNGNFLKQEILTTSTSPNMLECWDMKVADINNNGLIDIVVAETIGIVAYINDGVGSFIPQKITDPGLHMFTSIAILDANGNGLPDIIGQDFTGNFDLYINQSDTALNFTYHSNILHTTPSSIKSIRTGDLNENGKQDIFTAFNGTPKVLFNDGDLDFQTIFVPDSNPDHFVQHVLLADITGNSRDELIWSGAGGTLVYLSQEPVSVHQLKMNSVSIYPNPVSSILKIKSENIQEVDISISDSQGRKITSFSTHLPLSKDLSFLKTGIYHIQIKTGDGIINHSIIKH